MCNGVVMAIVQSTSNLTSEFSSSFFLEFAMRDNIIEHLSSIDIFKQHIVVMGHNHNITHSTNVWMTQEGRYSGFPNRSDLFAFIVVALLVVRILGILDIRIT